MSSPGRGPNIYDVAKLAQVSHQTVSRVINNHQSIRPETRSRVERAMATLGYSPNLAARALVTSRSKMLGILSSDTDFTGPASTVHHMEMAARKAGYFAVTCGIDPDSADSVLDGINHLRKLGIEGLLVVTPQSQAVDIARAELDTIPVVTIDSMYRMDELAVSMDNFAGGTAATEHLIGLGHTEIVHISGPKNWFESTTRSAGYTSAMLNARLTPRIIEGDWTLETGYRIGMNVDWDERAITAVFAANDQLALGLLRACQVRSIDVPGRLSLVGFDDLPETPYYNPPLTTLRQDFEALGQRAMQLLLNELQDEATLKHERLIPELIIRESTGPAPKL